MLADILFACWFFLPAGLANMTPILSAQAPWLKNFDTPLDFGKNWRGLSIFGPHKTWRGIITGTLAGMVIFSLQKIAYQNYSWGMEITNGVDYSALPLALGLLMGFGALAGDAVKSFFKRRFGRKSGDSWFPFDQLDYIIGGLVASLIFIKLELSVYVLIFIIWFGLHLLTSYIGYRLKLKPSPI